MSFDIIDWGNLSGTFATVTLPTLSSGLTWNTLQLYDTGILSVGLSGDYNQNGVVDAADYVVWRNNLGSTINLTADGDANGIVDSGDYNYWRARFGNTAGATSSSTAAVPEPMTSVLIGLAAGAILLSRPRGSVSACQPTVAGRNQKCGTE
jgi:hypothetical protein